MKHKLLPAVIAGITAVTGQVALAGGPTVYGKVNVTLNKYDLEALDGGIAVDNQDNWKMESNASRIGVKGDFEINENLKAIYKLEYEVFIDDGDDGDGGDSEFSQRNIYGGLQGSWGTLIAGKNDTPLKLAQGDVDQFNDLPLGDIKNLMVGENRESNIVIYTSPTIAGGLAISLSAMQGEEDGVSAGSDDDGLADSTSVAITYTHENFYLALANDSNVDNQDIIRAVGMVTMGGFEIGALYQTAEEHDSHVDYTLSDGLNDASSQIDEFALGGNRFEEQNAWLISGAYKFADKWKVKAQYGQSESKPLLDLAGGVTDLDDVESTLMAVGVDYKMHKNMKVFAYYAMIEAEGDSSFSNDKTEDKTFALGWEMKF